LLRAWRDGARLRSSNLPGGGLFPRRREETFTQGLRSQGLYLPITKRLCSRGQVLIYGTIIEGESLQQISGLSKMPSDMGAISPRLFLKAEEIVLASLEFFLLQMKFLSTPLEFLPGAL
jgi:hypothetical protein